MERKETVVHLNETGFIGHHVSGGILTPSEAKAKWKKLLDDPNIDKEVDDDGEDTVPVKLPKSTSVIDSFEDAVSVNAFVILLRRMWRQQLEM